jgi:hypothetical protein
VPPVHTDKGEGFPVIVTTHSVILAYMHATLSVPSWVMNWLIGVPGLEQSANPRISKVYILPSEPVKVVVDPRLLQYTLSGHGVEQGEYAHWLQVPLLGVSSKYWV